MDIFSGKGTIPVSALLPSQGCSPIADFGGGRVCVVVGGGVGGGRQEGVYFFVLIRYTENISISFSIL